MSDRGFSRRNWLAAVGLGAVAAATPDWLRAAPVAPPVAPTPRAGRALRVAHLTDTHVQPELGADQGFVKCLHHVQSLNDRPELILFGGDCIMDAMKRDAARTKIQWDLWHAILKNECSLPTEACIGNHDIWGWHKKRSKTTGEEPRYGKQWAMEALGLKRPYRSFDRGGWHFVVLDSVYPFRDGYKARLDDAQFAWLGADLAKTNPATPVLVLSHIPLLSVTPFMAKESAATGDFQFGGGAAHIDFLRVKDLFKQHPNVKVCVSGHQHLIDRCDYGGVSYLCNGAVSGGWWKGPHHDGDCPEGYAVLDLYADGTFDRQYVTYGWQAVPAPGAATAADPTTRPADEPAMTH